MTTPDPEPPAEQEPRPAKLQESMACWPTGRLLSTAARLVEHAWVEALDQLGLTHAGMVALHLLCSGPLSQTELAHAARVQTQTMSRTLERLERQGYVVRTRDKHDARRHSVVRTDAGTVVWEKSRTLEADLFPELENADAMRDALLTIISAASARRW
ncbi:MULTISPECIES: MarR family winged helix-turn-helix transcriptional regulator [unclassified Cryobacterium]|uniref:MarR family winged helix-turn-helix transcriptional regulator n=1 Tax=unclassified Cryobacterium TaxID=2649013 RepID=UPI001E55A912|nr:MULTISPECIES: MarR family transcriptional regulator [unclassified Cryobacterium]